MMFVIFVFKVSLDSVIGFYMQIVFSEVLDYYESQ